METERKAQRLWTWVSFFLSGLFAVLFYPIARETNGVVLSILLTALGIAVIWLVFVMRSWIFSRMAESGRREGKRIDPT